MPFFISGREKVYGSFPINPGIIDTVKVTLQMMALRRPLYRLGYVRTLIHVPFVVYTRLIRLGAERLSTLGPIRTALPCFLCKLM